MNKNEKDINMKQASCFYCFGIGKIEQKICPVCNGTDNGISDTQISDTQKQIINLEDLNKIVPKDCGCSERKN